MALIELFRGEAGGFGDAQRNASRPDSYNSTLHGIVAGGGFSPYFKPTAVTWAAADYRSGVDWRTSNGVPLILMVGGEAAPGLCQRIDSDGAVTQDRSFTGKTIGLGGGGAGNVPDRSTLSSVLHSDGSTVPMFIVCFGNSGDIEYRISDGTWATSSGTPARAAGLLSENGNIWAVVNNTDGGASYQVRKWPAGTNPISGTAGAAIDVGDSTWPITGGAVLARSYVVFVKPDGIYVFDIDTNRFENIAPWLGHNLDQSTGRGTKEWGGDVYVPLGWGGMLHVTQSLDVFDASPVPRNRRPDVETPGRNRIGSMAGDASFLYALHEPYWQLLQDEIGVTVLTTSDDSSFNDRTTVSTDNDALTSFTLNDLSTGGANSHIYVGATSRFLMPAFGIAASAASIAPTVKYWDGDSWESVTIADYTAKMTRIGVLQPAARIPADWAQNAVDGKTRFWLQINLASNVQSGTTVWEVAVLPDIIPAPGTNTSEDAFDRAGARTHLFRGYPTPEGFHWDDIASLEADHSLNLFLSRIQTTGTSRSLLAMGPLDYMRLPLGLSGEPRMERFPNCVNGFPSILRMGSDSYDLPTTAKQITALDVHGLGANEGDRVQAWAVYDDGSPVPIGHNFGLPCRLRVDPPDERGRGYLAAVWVGIEDAVQDRQVPLITRIVADIEVAPTDDSELGL